MILNIRKSVVLACLMFMAAYLSFSLTPTKQLSQIVEKIDLEEAVPKKFGEWRLDPNISPVLLSTATKENLEKTYDQILSRTYVNSAGERVMLSIAYGGSQNQQLRAHRQEVCYAAQGFRISQLQQISLRFDQSEISATRMLAQQGARSEPVIYWFTMGDDVVRSFFDRQLTQLKYAFSGYIPDGYLFRVSLLSSDVASAFKKEEQFADELLKSIDQKLARRLLGN